MLCSLKYAVHPALYRLWNDRLESSSGKGTWGSWSMVRSLSSSALEPGEKSMSWEASGRPGQGGDCPALLCAAGPPSSVLGEVLSTAT